MKRVNKAGFTLVELLVVIGIIALLISILLPVLSKARQSAISVQCMSNLRQMQMASEMYANGNHGWLLPICTYFDASGGTPSVWWSENDTTRNYLSLTPFVQKYYGDVNIKRVCQNATDSLSHPNPDGSVSMRYAYGMNFQDFIDPTRLPLYYIYSTPPKTWFAYKVSKIRNASEKLAWADALFPWIRVSGSGQYIGENHSAAGTNNVTAYRHNKGANIVFFDGHGEWRPRGDIDTTGWAQSKIDRLWYAYLP